MEDLKYEWEDVTVYPAPLPTIPRDKIYLESKGIKYPTEAVSFRMGEEWGFEDGILYSNLACEQTYEDCLAASNKESCLAGYKKGFEYGRACVAKATNTKDLENWVLEEFARLEEL